MQLVPCIVRAFFTIFTCVVWRDVVISDRCHLLDSVRHAMGREEVDLPFLCSGRFPCNLVLVLGVTWFIVEFGTSICLDLSHDIISCAEVVIYGQHSMSSGGI